ncbi:MAG TPA: L,D-transpeptidase [Gaiellaceae bacterium]|nr:L,D-transpeptidase [Gaiellaceae bacterium]
MALTLSLLAAAPVGAARPPVVAQTQELALLFSPHAVMSAADAHSTRLELVSNLRPITGERTALPVLGHKTGPGGARWLHVLLPGRPNGHTGWIAEDGTTHAVTGWHIVVDTSARRVTVYSNGRAVRAFNAIVGKPSTPTPFGTFFVEETIALRPGDVGAPYALALSARSNVLQEFEGGPGQIALHGLLNVGGVLGTAVSHGCVRLDSASMRWLVGRIGPGVPVTIR